MSSNRAAPFSASDLRPTQALLATAAPSRIDRRLAVFAILASVICFLLVAPFADTPLIKIDSFTAAYQSALAINDLITAILLFGQFVRLRTFSLLAIASAYLFEALVVVVHTLSFPGVFSPAGLFGSDQTTIWLWVFWHAAFPAWVLAYGLIAGCRWDTLPSSLSTGTAVLGAVAAVGAILAAATMMASVWVHWLPPILVAGDYTRLVSLGISPAMLALTAAAIMAMWRRRHVSVLDVWLFAVLWVWLCDVSLGGIVTAARFSVGWYGGRLFGLLAASFVLGALLLEANMLYSHLARSLDKAEAQNAELLRSRAELARAQRLEAVGQLTGGIAHDFNNLLTAIVGGLDMIIRKPQDQERVLRLAGNAQKAAGRGTRLVKQLMTFARQQNLKPEVLNPNSVLLEFESFAGRAAGEAVTVTFKLDHAVHPIRVDATEFQAAVLNLVTNARDAMPGGGTIQIESRNGRVAGGGRDGHPDMAPGDYVMIAVSDTGMGMAADTQAKAFEPFFTTKAVGAGTGLGLSQVFGFAHSADGHVALQSELGTGTTVTLYLPRSTHVQSLPPADTNDAPLHPAEDGESVLVVEDDAHVMTTTVESLRDLGYTVLKSETAHEALGVLSEDRRVDILFSDVVMPGGMNGVELAKAAQRLRPGLRVLLTSGYTGAALHPQGLPPDLPLLNKPYGREALADKLRVVLARR